MSSWSEYEVPLDMSGGLAKQQRWREEVMSTEKTCNCRWDGDTQVQQCTLHQAHLDAIHEWAERARGAEAERDALAAKLAELEGQTDNLLSTCHRLALELECLLLDTKDSALVSRWWDSAMVALDEWHKSKDLVSARPVPAERPVNARLLDALKRAKDSLVAFKFVPGGANCWEASDEENLTAVNSAIAAAEAAHTEPVNVDFGMRGENMFFQIGNQSFLLDYKPEEQGEFEFMKAMLLSAFSRISHGVKTESQPVNVRLLEALQGLLLFPNNPRENRKARAAIAEAEAQQERILQDMHDAGREIDRVMDEPAPKVPQIDLDAIARAIWNVRRQEEDRCDMELEDMRRDHSVWEEATEVASILKDAGIEVAE